MTRTQSKSAFRRVDAVIMVSGDNIVQDVNAIRVDRLLDLAHAIDFDFLFFHNFSIFFNIFLVRVG